MVSLRTWLKDATIAVWLGQTRRESSPAADTPAADSPLNRSTCGVVSDKSGPCHSVESEDTHTHTHTHERTSPPFSNTPSNQ